MLEFLNRERRRRWAPLPIRMILGVGFVVHGWAKWNRGPADIVPIQLDGIQLHLEPGQFMIPHGPDRNLTPAETLPQGKQP